MAQWSQGSWLIKVCHTAQEDVKSMVQTLTCQLTQLSSLPGHERGIFFDDEICLQQLVGDLKMFDVLLLEKVSKHQWHIDS